jgi:hypothetical protein
MNNTEVNVLHHFADKIPSRMGNMNNACSSCITLHWNLERSLSDLKKEVSSYAICCRKGAVVLPVDYTTLPYPPFLRELLEGTDDGVSLSHFTVMQRKPIDPHIIPSVSLTFQGQIQAYNNAIVFASYGMTIDRSVQGQQGIFSFRVSGALHHNIGLMFPLEDKPACFAQIYVTGGNDMAEARHHTHQALSPTNVELLLRIQEFLTSNNSYALFFRVIGQDTHNPKTWSFVLQNFQRPCLDQNFYNALQTQEVGMIIHHENPESIPERRILLTTRGGESYHFTYNFSGYLPVQYPIFFPYG